MDADEELARRLQEEEYKDLQQEQGATPDDVHLIDAPFKDLHGLFLAFNDLYFESMLSACEVKWSPRMTRCAGLCVYQPKAHFCSIRLSEPLLKFRPESDYIDTLLHEMIHAYLFITKAIQDHDGHGEDFLSHAKRINDAAGTNITVYHTFHDEVRHYQTHVWKCDGPCRTKAPYFGIVRRSMNRAPQPADRWWAEHQLTCGGTYTKISEPEPTTRKKKSKAKEGLESSTTSKPPPPRPRTMLDDFVIKQPSPNKAQKEVAAEDEPLSSTPPILSNQGYRLGGNDWAANSATNSSSPTPPLPLLSSTPLSATSAKPTSQVSPSPREAAALAAMARQERFLKEREQKNMSGGGYPISADTRTSTPATPGLPTSSRPSPALSSGNATSTSSTSLDGFGSARTDNKGNKRGKSSSPPPSPPLPPSSLHPRGMDLEAEEPWPSPRKTDMASVKKRKQDNSMQMTAAASAAAAGSPFAVVDLVDLTLDPPSPPRPQVGGSSSNNNNNNNSPPRPAAASTAASRSTTSTLEHAAPAQEIVPWPDATAAGTTKVTCPVCSNRVLEAEINDHIDLCIWRASAAE